MNWQAAMVDAVSVLVVGALLYMKVLPTEIGVPLLTAVIAARAALSKPPGDGPGGGGGMGASAAGAIGLGLMSVMGLLRARS